MNIETQPPVTLTAKEYTRLLQNSLMLGCLFEIGIATWPKYTEAEQLYRTLLRKELDVCLKNNLIVQ